MQLLIGRKGQFINLFRVAILMAKNSVPDPPNIHPNVLFLSLNAPTTPEVSFKGSNVLTRMFKVSFSN